MPGELYVIKRAGTTAIFDRDKIRVAIEKAFRAVFGESITNEAHSVKERPAKIANDIELKIRGRMPSGGCVHIEDIQDQVELALMRTESREVARPMFFIAKDRPRALAAKYATKRCQRAGEGAHG